MLKKYSFIFIVFMWSMLLIYGLTPVYLFANTYTQNHVAILQDERPPVSDGSGSQAGTNPERSSGTQANTNPERSSGTQGLPPITGPGSDICSIINAVLKVIAEIGAVVGVLFIIWSGFLFIMAQGNVDKLKRAKWTFLTTIAGIAILLGASVITSVIFNTISSVTGADGSTTSICKKK
jgi:hypothetical protein